MPLPHPLPLVAMLSASGLLTACVALATGAPSVPAAPSAPSTATAAPLDRSAWTLAALPGFTLPAGGPVATLSFEAGRMQGSDGCNRWGAPVEAADGRLKMTAPMMGTQMACGEPAASLARAFQAALARAQGYRLTGAGDARSLELTDASGAAVARFAAQSTALAGTAWTVGAYNNGRQAVVSVAAGTAPSLAFGADGRVSGSGGCNTFSGAYRVDGERLSIGPLATTRMACAQPDGVMAQEAAYLKALQSTASFRREADRLSLHTADGARAADLSLTR